MLRYKATKSLGDRLQVAGTSHPVNLSDEDWGLLLVVLAQWRREVVRKRLPASVANLLDALTSDR